MVSENSSLNSYTSKDVQELTEREHLIKRMGVTMGPESGDESHPFSSQKTKCIIEIQDNALDEVRAEYGTRTKVTIIPDQRRYIVQDAGRGLPVDVSKDIKGRNVSGVYKTLGVIRSGAKYSTDSKRFSSGLNGMGGASAVALSEQTVVKVYRPGLPKEINFGVKTKGSKPIPLQYELHFKDGTPGFFDNPETVGSKFTALTDLSVLRVQSDPRGKKEREKYPTGTLVDMILNDSVFQSSYPVDTNDLIFRLHSAALLTPRLQAEIVEHPTKTGEYLLDNSFFVNDNNHAVTVNENNVRTVSVHFANGISEPVKQLAEHKTLGDTIVFHTEGAYVEKNVKTFDVKGEISSADVERNVRVHLGMIYDEGFDSRVDSYVNTIRTKLDGVHVNSFKKALTDSVKDQIPSFKGVYNKKNPEIEEADITEGLYAILHVEVAEPSFSNQAKERLNGNEVRKTIYTVLKNTFDHFFKSKQNRVQAELLMKKFSAAAINRQKARERQELNRQKNKVSSSSLPDTLVDCQQAGTDDAQLYICEGISALTSLKGARDGNLHALLPIRGKIISALKASMKSIYANKEVQDIIRVIGAKTGSEYNSDDLRYGKIFIATDADDDGLHISVLLYALFWRIYPDIIREGRLYKINTPLFVVSTKQGKKSAKHYAQNEDEREQILKELDKKNIKYTVTRLKGLGECNDDVLEETALNADTRVITRITLTDVKAAEQMLEITMGKDSNLRKDWIADNYAYYDSVGD